MSFKDEVIAHRLKRAEALRDEWWDEPPDYVLKTLDDVTRLYYLERRACSERHVRKRAEEFADRALVRAEVAMEKERRQLAEREAAPLPPVIGKGRGVLPIDVEDPDTTK